MRGATALASTGAGRLCAALSSCNSGSVCLCFRCLGPARCACYGAAFSWRQAFARRCFRAAAAACASALVALGSRGVSAMALTSAGAGRTCAALPSCSSGGVCFCSCRLQLARVVPSPGAKKGQPASPPHTGGVGRARVAPINAAKLKHSRPTRARVRQPFRHNIPADPPAHPGAFGQ